GVGRREVPAEKRWGGHDLRSERRNFCVALLGMSSGLRRGEPGAPARRRDLEGVFLRRPAGGGRRHRPRTREGGRDHGPSLPHGSLARRV
ncbi:MAG: hypothetical protein AVDCRST_MAG03-784, partial [uncultured Rubrobacteraceae bacterium]